MHMPGTRPSSSRAPGRPGPQRRGSGSDGSRRTLFAAAAREFAAHGFAGGSVDRIAAAAKLNKAMIYYHFGSKAGLYREILRDMFAAVGARVHEAAASDRPPEEKVRQFVVAIATEAEARPHFPPIWFREIAEGGAHLDAETLRHVASVLSALRKIIEDGVRAGRFKPVNVFLVHAGIVGPLLLHFVASGALRKRLQKAGVPVAENTRDEVLEHIFGVALATLEGRTS
jgi:TetR/AcrR family transcriptional regulator